MRDLSISPQIIRRAAEECYETYTSQIKNVYANRPLWWENQSEDLQNFIIEEISIYLYNPGCSDEEIHKIWLNLKQIQGWTYGTVLSFENKTSPSIKPYSAMDEDEKNKIQLYQDVCNSIIKNAKQ